MYYKFVVDRLKTSVAFRNLNISTHLFWYSTCLKVIATRNNPNNSNRDSGFHVSRT